ncbi:TonB-dependent receptor [Flavihumibacter rivuli]|uniref:SusC/RagA family TonB-linked outer membrane protein n=1 Tax=Flavihumibacter rivuli TaxID=2838156 RepID=UPI001BDE95A3|nr:TonB-dependent receptor [Flavihumibacter rivuli]ULQ58117.1 TonB-dependent receptor [Flavihumibacter rivuli]
MPKQTKMPILGKLLAILFALIALNANAQKAISGKLTGKNNTPLSGATVLIKGTTIATATDDQGNFSINLPEGKNTLVISSVGFKTKEVVVGPQTSLTIALDEEAAGLSEVVVTGYSSQARKNIVGAVSTVKGEQLQAVQSGNVEQQFQGRVPGMTVITSGQPGTVSQVRIRGFGSFTSNDPMYIVDGIPTFNVDFLNANDIESTTVLKDAASASIYGARASAGVIVITTKKGRTGRGVKVTYDMTYGRTYPGKGIDMLTPQQQADMTWTALKNAGQATTHPQYGAGATPVLPDYLKVGDEYGLSGLSANDPRLDPSKFNVNFDKGPIYQVIKANKAGTDWYGALTDAAPLQNHTLGFSGGSDAAKYYAGISYYDERGTVINTFVKRYSLRLNTEFKVGKNVRFGENFQFTHRENPNIGGPAGENDIMFALTINPLIPVYDEGGGYAGTTARGFNNSTQPVARRIRSKDNRGFSAGIFGNLYGEVDFAKHFTFRSSFGGSFVYFQNRFLNYRTYENSENVGNYTFGEGAGNVAGWTWTNTIKYSQDFGDHNVNFIGGIEAIADGYARTLSGQGLNPFSIDPNYVTITNTDPNGRLVNSGGQPLTKLFSQFGKVDYSYDDRYLLSATLRRDGASVFGEDNRYGVFPALSLGWRITEENFMKNIDWITELKIRGGWGKMGNSRISPSNLINAAGAAATFGYDIGGGQTSTSPGLAITSIGNPFAKWEGNTTVNIGFDGTFFNNKLDVIFDWYQRKTDDLLFRDALPAVVGDATRPFVNIGSMKNGGVDAMVTYRDRIGKVRFEVDGIFTKYKNEITKVSEGTDFFDVTFTNRIGGGVVRNAKGQPVSSFYGYQVIGLFADDADVSKSPTQDGAAPGRFKYADVNGDGAITAADRTYIGNPNPDFTYGLNARVFYAGFDFEALFYGVAGGEVLNFTKWFTDFYPSFAGIGKSSRMLDAWTPENKNTSVPRAENISNFSTNNVLNSYYVEDGSYFRLRSLKVGYTFKESSIKRFGLDRLRLFIQGTNLFTITKYTGTDPAVSGVDTNFGVDVGNYPVNKQFLFGINVGL